MPVYGAFGDRSGAVLRREPCAGSDESGAGYSRGGILITNDKVVVTKDSHGVYHMIDMRTSRIKVYKNITMTEYWKSYYAAQTVLREA